MLKALVKAKRYSCCGVVYYYVGTYNIIAFLLLL